MSTILFLIPSDEFVAIDSIRDKDKKDKIKITMRFIVFQFHTSYIIHSAKFHYMIYLLWNLLFIVCHKNH